MSDEVSKPAGGQEQSPTFQYMQDQVARGMANFYAAYRSQQSGTDAAPAPVVQPKKSGGSSTSKRR